MRTEDIMNGGYGVPYDRKPALQSACYSLIDRLLRVVDSTNRITTEISKIYMNG